VIEHAEALAIELRLARRFNLLGANAFEESQIMSLFSNTRAIMHRHEDAYFSRSQFRTEERDKFINTKLSQWIATHEKVLKENGSTGFYIGDKVTLAEIKTAVAVDQLLNELYVFKGFEGIKKLITPELTPNLWKVRENVLQKKSYKDWTGSAVFQELKDGTTELLTLSIVSSKNILDQFFSKSNSKGTGVEFQKDAFCLWNVNLGMGASCTYPRSRRGASD